MPDDEVAEKIGRTLMAVRMMRTRKVITNACDQRRRDS